MKLKLSLTLVAAFLCATPTMAADIAAGKAKAGVCAGCHGPDGMSFIPNYPNLKGQKAAYMVKQLKDFKNNTRKDPVMSAQATSLSDEDIANISAYYESLGKK